MFSQNDEEAILLELAGNAKGRFLDIGAFDGVTFSNTRALVEKGWCGICVEPNPFSFLKLLKACENHDIECVLAAVGPPCEAGITPFYGKLQDGHDAAVSTINDAHRDKWVMAVGGWTSFHVPVITPHVLLKHFGQHFDFVNIDVEGGNWNLLQQMPIREMNTDIWCVEFDTHFAQMEEWFKGYGYEIVHITTENLIARKT